VAGLMIPYNGGRWAGGGRGTAGMWIGEGRGDGMKRAVESTIKAW
jgi:hypothetical protein